LLLENICYSKRHDFT